MDIGENVTAILCVVVGILIIGTALIPIVQHASSGEESISIGGYNNDDESMYVIDLDPLDTISASYTEFEENNLSINGTPIRPRDMVLFGAVGDAFGDSMPDFIIMLNIDDLQVYYNGETYEPSAINLSVSNLIATFTFDSNGEITLTHAVKGCMVNAVDDLNLDLTRIYIPGYTDATFGANQAIFCNSRTYTAENIGTDSFSVNGTSYTVTVSESADAYRFSIDPEGYFGCPYAWTVCESSESQYAALYGIIPIMCILGMGYVLIRRF